MQMVEDEEEVKVDATTPPPFLPVSLSVTGPYL